MKFDFHTHHERCGHARGSIEDYIRQAIKYDLQMIGISDHSPFFAVRADHSNPRIAMAKSEFPKYVEEVLRLKEKYAGKIEVQLGVESDFFPDHVELYRSVYNRYPFDYIIGSVHSIQGISVFNKDRWRNLSESQQTNIKNEYLHYIRQSASCGLFQILGHIDAMKSYYPAYSHIPGAELERTMKSIADADVAIEINTSYHVKKTNWSDQWKEQYAADTDWYPSNELLELAHFYGVKVTFGSDSHDPKRIAEDFDKVRKTLRAIGFKEWAIFRKKERMMVSLGSV